MGRIFYEGTAPRVAKALERIAGALEKLAPPEPEVADEEEVSAVILNTLENNDALYTDNADERQFLTCAVYSDLTKHFTLTPKTIKKP